ncbi:MAG: tetratricopeptide repeat protein, partial [Terriglobales bacterium]
MIIFCALLAPAPAFGQGHAPYSPSVAEHLKQSHELIESGRHDQASALLVNIIRTQPDCGEAYTLLGMLYLKQGNLRQAEATLHKACELDSGNANAFNNYANALYRQLKVKESVEPYRKALALSREQDPKILANLANAYADLNMLDDAAAMFLKAVKVRPDYAVAYFGLGRMYYDHNKLDMAEVQ